MMRNIGRIFSRISHRYVPDPFVLAIGLTTIVCVLALPRLGYDLNRVANGWVEGNGKGLWRRVSNICDLHLCSMMMLSIFMIVTISDTVTK